ncbi:hypothetical protein [Promicromonospora iranensis]|uniref:PH (Pleckstrin Homology) domain-containing protein n=1 Tax=Promicromonospora iranensis TaxID=1105144 RepID=A0ABU2CLK0_9MICO|nr:hypothetical protein [Promicromonospora iranensis]MDR7382219.1 hypothetical protein [Promicromonospora iranensis]
MGTVVGSGLVRFVTALTAFLVPLMVASNDAVASDEIWTIIAFPALLFFAIILNSGGRISVSSSGLLSRNIVTERWYPWASVAGIAATDRVEVIHADGGRSRCWAVQQANISAMLSRVSRVNHVVAELEEHRQRARAEPDADVAPLTRMVRFTWWELVQLLVLFPGAVALGVWLFG